MKYIVQLGIIMGISFVAELLYLLLPLPVPASVYGLLLLLVLLLTGGIKLEQVEGVADFMISVMPLFFVPSAVALITSVESIKGNVLKLLIICALSTIVVTITTGRVAQRMVQRKKQREEKEDE